MKILILTFFAVLSTSEPEVNAHLLTSTTVIPSMILLLSQLTTAFWEDDEVLMSEPSSEINLCAYINTQLLTFSDGSIGPFVFWIKYYSSCIISYSNQFHSWTWDKKYVFHNIAYSTDSCTFLSLLSGGCLMVRRLSGWTLRHESIWYH